MTAPRKRPKYGNRITMINGIRFHSAGEAGRYQELKLLQRAKKIADLFLQAQYPLHVVSGEGTRELVGKYIADFRYFDFETYAWTVEDFKGHDTAFARWKRKHCELEYGIKIILTGKR